MLILRYLFDGPRLRSNILKKIKDCNDILSYLEGKKRANVSWNNFVDGMISEQEKIKQTLTELL